MIRTLSAACILRFPARPPFRPSAGRSPLPATVYSVARWKESEKKRWNVIQIQMVKLLQSCLFDILSL